MQHFFINPADISGDKAYIRGADRHHIAHVLRMKKGEELLISTGEDWDYLCVIENISEEFIVLSIKSENEAIRELDTELILYQALPKSDKMELIIQKAVELGVKRIVPIITKRVIVKLDKKAEKSKIERWQRLSESAAKQSKRSIIPKIREPISFKECLEEIVFFDKAYLAYEEQRTTAATLNSWNKIRDYKSIAVCIGPEGGFEDTEIELAKLAGFEIISLGRRILRTETAGFVVLSNLMMRLD